MQIIEKQISSEELIIELPVLSAQRFMLVKFIEKNIGREPKDKERRQSPRVKKPVDIYRPRYIVLQ